ncbi:hypothetical protein [Venenivibrio stagnispumantis]|nr:hypothetical protein [Venenivibrio stagnispumantis]
MLETIFIIFIRLPSTFLHELCHYIVAKLFFSFGRFKDIGIID